MAFAVGFRRVKGRDAALKCGPVGSDGLVVIDADPAGLTRLPAAEDDGADLNFRASERSVLHGLVPLHICRYDNEFTHIPRDSRRAGASERFAAVRV